MEMKIKSWDDNESENKYGKIKFMIKMKKES